MKSWAKLSVALACASALCGSVRAQGRVLVLPYSGPIGPASAAYFERGIAQAEQQNAAAIIIELDTPGGLDTSMRQIVQREMSSRVPVFVFVAPAGARAASAGCIIALGADVIAMAPGTNIGAAHPVYSDGSTVSEKIVNDAAAYARSLAGVHGRDVQWAERAVRESVSASAQEAVQSGIADLIAADLNDLLAKLDGRQIRRASGGATIATRGDSIAMVELDSREKLVAIVTNPTIAYLLFLLGALAIIVEIFAPHGFVTGTIGFLAILASLAGIVDLPIQVAGAALLIAGMILLGLELKITSHGALTVIGLIAFIAGSFLVLPRMPGFAISAWAIVTVAILWAAILSGAVRLVLRSRHAPVLTGVQRVAGKTGVAKTDIAPRGVVLVNGEDWDALADASPISRGERIAVDSVEGLTLHVRKIS